MTKKILGFDASSSTIGYAVLLLDEKKKTIAFESVAYFKPSKDGNILDRLSSTRDKVKDIIEKIKPDYIAIEDIIMFIRNKSSAQTVITLAVFNRMVGLLARDYLGQNPQFFNVLSIRHGLKLTPDFPDKSEMPELVAKHLGINFPYEYNKKGKAIIENEDQADAIAVALFYGLVLLGQKTIKIPKKTKKVKKVKVRSKKK